MRLFVGALLAEWSAHDLVERGIDLPVEVHRAAAALPGSSNGNLLASPVRCASPRSPSTSASPPATRPPRLGVRVHRQVEEVLAAAGGAREVPRELLAAVAHRLTALAALGAGRARRAPTRPSWPRRSRPCSCSSRRSPPPSPTSTRYVGSVLARADLDDDEWLGFKHLLLDYLETIVESVDPPHRHDPPGPRPARAALAVLVERPSAGRPRRSKRLRAASPGGEGVERARGRARRRLGRAAGLVRRRPATGRPGAQQLRAAAARAVGALLANVKRMNAASQPRDVAAPALPPPRRLVRRGDARRRPRAVHVGVRPLRRPAPRRHARPRGRRGAAGHHQLVAGTGGPGPGQHPRAGRPQPAGPGRRGSPTTAPRRSASLAERRREAEQRAQAVAELARRRRPARRGAAVGRGAAACCSSCSAGRRPASGPIWPAPPRPSSTPTSCCGSSRATAPTTVCAARSATSPSTGSASRSRRGAAGLPAIATAHRGGGAMSDRRRPTRPATTPSARTPCGCCCATRWSPPTGRTPRGSARAPPPRRRWPATSASCSATASSSKPASPGSTRRGSAPAGAGRSCAVRARRSRPAPTPTSRCAAPCC